MCAAQTNPPVIIDVGTGYTKLGYSTNSRPDFIIPTMIGNRDLKNVTAAQMKGTEDLDFYIGYEAIQNSTHYVNTNIMKHGQIDDWDDVGNTITRVDDSTGHAPSTLVSP